MLEGRDAVAHAYTLEKLLYGDRVPRSQNDRAYYGRSLDLDVIESAIRQAADGNMVAVTDLGRESVLMIDGHTTGVVSKRLNRAAAIDWAVVPNAGVGRHQFDHVRARERADFVRAQVMRIPMFRERLTDIAWSTWDNRAALETGWQVGTGASAGDSRLAQGWRAADLHWIHPRRLSYNQNRDLVVLSSDVAWQPSNFKPVGFRIEDVPEKFVTSTPRLFNDFREREGLLMRVMYWSFFQRLGTRERLELMEIFGAPWRLVKSVGDRPANKESLESSFRSVAQMGSHRAAWLSPGVDADFIQPGPGSGGVHRDAIEDARLVISKFVLGGTATTDVQASGLASNIGNVQLTEEDLIIAADLFHRASVIEHRLIDPIIELNYGPAELEYSPEFRFSIRGVNDSEKNGRVIKGALDAGVEVSLEQAYDLLQIRTPRDNEPRLSMVSIPSAFGPPSREIRVVYPAGQAPPPGDLALPPEEPLDLPGDEPPGGAPRPPGASPAPPAAAPAPPPPPPASLPQTPARAAPPPPPGGAPRPEPPAAAATDHPFASPSGLAATDRE